MKGANDEEGECEAADERIRASQLSSKKLKFMHDPSKSEIYSGVLGLESSTSPSSVHHEP